MERSGDRYMTLAVGRARALTGKEYERTGQAIASGGRRQTLSQMSRPMMVGEDQRRGGHWGEAKDGI